jgi:predicted nucleic-acid-binding protein
MRSVDASLLLASLKGGPQAGPAEAFIRSEGPVWISHLVLAETVRVLEAVYGRTRAQMEAALERLLDNKDLVLEDPDCARAALETYRDGLDFEDALALETARRAGHLPMATLRDSLRGVSGAVLPGA